MKFNKWTLGLAAVGVVSLASAVNAEEKTYLETAVSGTQISGYVNVSAQWNPGDNAPGSVTGLAAYQQGTAFSGSTTKADGFNLDAVSVTIAKPLDETEYASGYVVQLVYGQDAGFASSDSPIKQAYVQLRTPVGNGIDWKIGVFDTIVGYEVFDAGSNPNYTRSYGFTLEPTTHTGILGSYKFSDVLSAQLGIANTTDAGYGTRSDRNESKKSYMGSLALTAPESWGFLAGSTLYAAAVVGNQTGSAQNNANYYVGTVLNTGVKGLKVGASYDYAGLSATTSASTGTIGGGLSQGGQASWANAVAVYASFQATEKLSLHARGEYAWIDSGLNSANLVDTAYALTGTVQYDLWKNVLSRLEVRWDHAENERFGSTPANQNSSVLVAANLIYKF